MKVRMSARKTAWTTKGKEKKFHAAVQANGNHALIRFMCFEIDDDDDEENCNGEYTGKDAIKCIEACIFNLFERLGMSNALYNTYKG